MLLPDSVDIVGQQFLWYNEYSTPPQWEVEEPNLENIYQEHPWWINAYFPATLKRYQLTFGRRLLLYGYLYLEGEREYFCRAKSEAASDFEHRSVKQIADNFKINLEAEGRMGKVVG